MKRNNVQQSFLHAETVVLASSAMLVVAVRVIDGVLPDSTVLRVMMVVFGLPVGAVVLGGFWLAIATWHRRHDYEKAAGLCVRCGYDLCETPDRCPECGLPRQRRR